MMAHNTRIVHTRMFNMKILLLLFFALRLSASDKLDRSYLPPPGSKFAGGSPGAIETPLEFPKETYPSEQLQIQQRNETSGGLQATIGINRQPEFPTEASATAQSLRPVGGGAKRPLSFHKAVPTTTTSYAFTQTTTYSPIDGFHTTPRLFDALPSVPTKGLLPILQQNIHGINIPQINSQLQQQLSQLPDPTSSPGTGILRTGFVQPAGHSYIPGEQIIDHPDYVKPDIELPGQQNQDLVQQLGVQQGLRPTVIPSLVNPPGTYPVPNIGQQGPFSSTVATAVASTDSSLIPSTIAPEILSQYGQLNVQPGINRPTLPNQQGPYPSTASAEASFSYGLPNAGQPFPSTTASASASTRYGQSNAQAEVKRPIEFIGQQGSVPSTAPGVPKQFGQIGTEQAQHPVQNIGQSFFPSTIAPGSTPQFEPVNKQVNIYHPTLHTGQQSPLLSTATPVSPAQYAPSGLQNIQQTSQRINQQTPFPTTVSPGIPTQFDQPGVQDGGRFSQQGPSQRPYQSNTGLQEPSTQYIQPSFQPGVQRPTQIISQGLSPSTTPTNASKQHILPNVQSGIRDPTQLIGERDSLLPTSGSRTQSITQSGVQRPIQKVDFQDVPVDSIQSNYPGSRFQRPLQNVGQKPFPSQVTGSTSSESSIRPSTGAQFLQTPIHGSAQTGVVRRPSYGQNQRDQNIKTSSQRHPIFTPSKSKISDVQTYKPGSTVAPLFSKPTSKGVPNYSTSLLQGARKEYPSSPAYPGASSQVYAEGISRPERPQAESDRNAVILNYDNVITPEGFSYSFDTSNGIHADENGTAIDGVKAEGTYSYTGDDGKVYTIEYTADENGFLPRGDHLPTAPPIPEAIQRVVEQNIKEIEAGISDDGSYDEVKYGHMKYLGVVDRYRPDTHDDQITSYEVGIPATHKNRFGEASRQNDGSRSDRRKPVYISGDRTYKVPQQFSHGVTDGLRKPIPSRRPSEVSEVDNQDISDGDSIVKQKGYRRPMKTGTKNQSISVFSSPGKKDSVRRPVSLVPMYQKNKYPESLITDEETAEKTVDFYNKSVQNVNKGERPRLPSRLPGESISNKYFEGTQSSDLGNVGKRPSNKQVLRPDGKKSPDSPTTGIHQIPSSQEIEYNEDGDSREKIPSRSYLKEKDSSFKGKTQPKIGKPESKYVFQKTNQQSGYEYSTPQKKFNEGVSRFPSRSQAGEDYSTISSNENQTVRPFMTTNVLRGDEPVKEHSEDDESSLPNKSSYDTIKKPRPSDRKQYEGDAESSPDYYDEGIESDQEIGDDYINATARPGQLGTTPRTASTRHPTYKQQYSTRQPQYATSQEGIQKGTLRSGQREDNRFLGVTESSVTPSFLFGSTTPMPSQTTSVPLRFGSTQTSSIRTTHPATYLPIKTGFTDDFSYTTTVPGSGDASMPLREVSSRLGTTKLQDRVSSTTYHPNYTFTTEPGTRSKIDVFGRPVEKLPDSSRTISEKETIYKPGDSITTGQYTSSKSPSTSTDQTGVRKPPYQSVDNDNNRDFKSKSTYQSGDSTGQLSAADQAGVRRPSYQSVDDEINKNFRPKTTSHPGDSISQIRSDQSTLADQFGAKRPSYLSLDDENKREFRPKTTYQPGDSTGQVSFEHISTPNDQLGVSRPSYQLLDEENNKYFRPKTTYQPGEYTGQVSSESPSISIDQIGERKLSYQSADESNKGFRPKTTYRPGDSIGQVTSGPQFSTVDELGVSRPSYQSLNDESNKDFRPKTTYRPEDSLSQVTSGLSSIPVDYTGERKPSYQSVDESNKDFRHKTTYRPGDSTGQITSGLPSIPVHTGARRPSYQSIDETNKGFIPKTTYKPGDSTGQVTSGLPSISVDHTGVRRPSYQSIDESNKDFRPKTTYQPEDSETTGTSSSRLPYSPSDQGSGIRRPIDQSVEEGSKDSSSKQGQEESVPTFARPYGGQTSTKKVIGEDFSGPKQPQRYDPGTGYHYK